MTAASSPEAASRQRHHPGAAALVLPGWAKTALWLLLALALALILQSVRLQRVWSSGAFFDTDDAMRMVQARDLLAGQSWFDMTAYRLDPPQGMFSHWTRLVDIPLAALVLLFRLFLDADMAERAARVAFPSLMLLGLFGAGIYAARVYVGRNMRLMGVAAMFCCGVMFWQFPPGRVDHHAPQIVALLIAVVAMAEAFGSSRAKTVAALSGAMTALSLAIGLENLPFLAVVALVPGLAFLFLGAAARDMLLGYALGLAGAIVPLFLITVSPDRWGVRVCDALSGAHMLAVLLGCGGYALLAASVKILGRPWRRIAALGAVGALAASPLLGASAACLLDPFAGIDPVVRRLWLDRNPEVMSIAEEFRIDPDGAIVMAVPLLIGFCGALFGVWRTSGVARGRWALLSVQIALGLVAGALHLRVFSTIMPLAAVGLLGPVAALRDYLAAQSDDPRRRHVPVIGALAAIFFASSFGVTLAVPELKPQTPARNAFWRPACERPEFLRAPRGIPAGAGDRADLGRPLHSRPYAP